MHFALTLISLLAACAIAATDVDPVPAGCSIYNPELCEASKVPSPPVVECSIENPEGCEASKVAQK